MSDETPAPVTPAIEVIDLHRQFPGHHAVRGLSFKIMPGQVVGFIGANGAGKTTTMRILATLDAPTTGEARVAGFNVMHQPREVRARLGWMPDSYGAYEHMTVLEYLDFYARALGYKKEDRAQRVQDVVDFADLMPLLERFVDKLSKGQGQRLCLARALLNDPQILIMDEPAAGLDPKARVELKQLIRILAEEGKTILISSHILSELGEMCDSLLFIDQGQIVHHGGTESLQQVSETAETLVEVRVCAGAQAQLAEWVQTAQHVSVVEETKLGARLKIAASDETVVAGVLKRLVLDGVPVVDFRREERRLEDAFIDMLGHLEKKPQSPSAPPPLPE
jgi:ABC-2 type transport system ATP-binding protein